MDRRQTVDNYYGHSAPRSLSQSSQTSASIVELPIASPMASGQHAAPPHPSPLNSVHTLQSYAPPTESVFSSPLAARPPARFQPSYHEPRMMQHGPINAYHAYPGYHDPEGPSPSLYGTYGSQSQENAACDPNRATRSAIRHVHSPSTVTQESMPSRIHSSFIPYYEEAPPGHMNSDSSATSRFAAGNSMRPMHTATSPTLSGPEFPRRETGARIPLSGTPTSGMPSQRDFPVGTVPQTFSTKREDSLEPDAPEKRPNALPMGPRNGSANLATPFSLDDAYQVFPRNNTVHEILRLNLVEVMNSRWRQSNEKEPDSQVLLQFTEKVVDDGVEKLRCLFWIEGEECDKRISRADRMLEHLRRHISVRPWACNCNSEGCPGEFPSKAAMYQHQKNVEPVICQRCGAHVLRQNLARHLRAQRCKNPEEAAGYTYSC